MLSEADRAVLDESFQNTRMAGEAIHMVIGKVEDEDLAAMELEAFFRRWL